MKWFSIQPLHFELATWKITSSTTDLQTFLQESIAYGCEGVGLSLSLLSLTFAANDQEANGSIQTERSIWRLEES